MGLVVEPGGHGDLRGRQPVEQQAPGEVDATARQVAVPRHPVLAGERAHEVGRRRAAPSAAHARAVARGTPVAVFTADLFATGHDEANRAAVPRADLDLVGIAVHGPRNGVDKIMKGARLFGR